MAGDGKIFLADCTLPAVEAHLRESAKIVVPVGATEQHGPHAPFGTDAMLAELPEPELHAGEDVRGLRVGVVRDAPFAPVEPDVDAALEEALAILGARGVVAEEVELPEFEPSLAAEFAIVAAEAASYHEARLVRAADRIGNGRDAVRRADRNPPRARDRA